MRRRKRKKGIPIMKILVLIIIFMSVVSFGYSYLSLVLRIGGNVTGEMSEQSYTLSSDSDQALSLKIYQMSKQYQNYTYRYHYSLSVKNVSSSTITGIRITFDTNSNIGNVSVSGYNHKVTGKSIAVTSSNKVLSNGETMTIDLIIETSASNLQIVLVKLEKINTTGTGSLNVAFNIINSMDTYIYTYSVTITNNTSTRISGWQIDLSLPTETSYVSGSGAIFTATNNIVTIKNGKSNSKINAGGSITIQLQLSTNIINYIPNNVTTTVG